MKVLASWTRNTWDAHPAFDVHISPRLGHILNQVRRFSTRSAFWIEESIGLASYTSTCYKHWLFGNESTDNSGSELVLLAERDDM
jgi:hypothetical protein